MASWKGLYSNVDVLEQQTEDPKVLDQRKWADSKENPEVESTYEPIDPAIRLNGKKVELLPADCSPACWKPTFTCRTGIVTGALVLTTSVSLNVLLLALGLVHYSKMVATLEQAHQENKQLQEAACSPFSMDWTFFQGSYYFFSYSPGNWDVANQSCTSMGFHLVTINSIEEKGHVATIMKAPSCWIGLTDQALEGDWKWVDGTYTEHGNRYQLRMRSNWAAQTSSVHVRRPDCACSRSQLDVGPCRSP
ncbi:putative antigen C [Crotalus adamanteus]|uniref:Antigen C n=1 Tax=Crotalus adamanteus TaxID=8729 RepID=A0AAW1C1N6_CROAD